MPVGPFHVHSQQHGGPILGFGAARAGLNIEKRVVRIHLAGKHALELEPFDFAGQRRCVRLDLLKQAFVAFLRGQLHNLAGIAQAARQPVQTGDDLLEFRALPAQFLRALGVVPDSGLLEFAGYFLQALALVVVIKDTSSKSRYAPRDL